MDTPAFASLMTQERTRIHDAIKTAKAKRQEADREVAQLEAQLAAIAAYDAAIKGKHVLPTEPGAPRARLSELPGLDLRDSNAHLQRLVNAVIVGP